MIPLKDVRQLFNNWIFKKNIFKEIKQLNKLTHYKLPNMFFGAILFAKPICLFPSYSMLFKLYCFSIKLK